MDKKSCRGMIGINVLIGSCWQHKNVLSKIIMIWPLVGFANSFANICRFHWKWLNLTAGNQHDNCHGGSCHIYHL